MRKSEIDMCQGSILPQMIRFGLPVLFTGILQQLFNAADVILGTQHGLLAESGNHDGLRVGHAKTDQTLLRSHFGVISSNAIVVRVTDSDHVVVFTENVFQTRKDAVRQPLQSYNKLDDPYITALCEKARRYHTYIVCSVLERDADDLKRLTGLLINRDGEIQNIYRKTHLTMIELEGGSILENELPVFQTDFGTVGIQICWDHFFPECSRALALKGAELLLIPTHGFQKERLVMRALENGVHVVSAYTFSCGTMILTPNGSVADEAEGKGYAFAEVDLNEPVWRPWLSCNSSADINPTYLLERRPELYGNLCDPIDY